MTEGSGSALTQRETYSPERNEGSHASTSHTIATEDEFVASFGAKRILLDFLNRHPIAPLVKRLNLHNQGKTSYLEMSRGLANSGTEAWTFDSNKMTMTYYDRLTMAEKSTRLSCSEQETALWPSEVF